MSDDPYVYPGTSVLKNRLGLISQTELDAAERLLTRIRAVEGIPGGDFDLRHLQAIHRHLFQDVYAWAGELRSVEISKDGRQFIFRQFIRSGMADIHRRLRASRFLNALSPRSVRHDGGADHGRRELRASVPRGERAHAVTIFEAFVRSGRALA